MPQIISVAIKGFQSHVSSAIQLGPGLNVITGPSGSGKTAAIRAVRWVAFNEPTGEAFINEKVGEAEVTIALDNGVTITKTRKAGKTKYWLTGYQEPFEKAEVPEEVAQALGIHKQTFGDFVTALNFAYQLEAPFILSETASAGAKILGKLAGTEVVDLAVKAVGKDTYAARQERTAADKEVARINGDLLQYADVGEVKRALEAAEYLISVVDETLARGERLKETEKLRKEAVEKLDTVAEKLEQLAVVPAIENDMKDVEKAQQRYDTLLDLYSQHGKATATVERLTEELTLYDGLEGAAYTLNLVDTRSVHLATLSSLSTVYTDYSQEYKKAQDKLNNLEHTEEAASMLESTARQTERAAGLALVSDQYKTISGNLKAAEVKIESLAAISEAEAVIEKAQADYERLMRLRRLRTEHRLAHEDLQAAASNVEAADLTAVKAAEELTQAWEAAGEVCPICEQPVNKHSQIERGRGNC